MSDEDCSLVSARLTNRELSRFTLRSIVGRRKVAKIVQTGEPDWTKVAGVSSGDLFVLPGGTGNGKQIKWLAKRRGKSLIVRTLPPNKQKDALRLLDTLASGASSEPNGTGLDRRLIWEVVEEINAALHADTWENVPTDGSINLDHYLYGALNR